MKLRVSAMLLIMVNFFGLNSNGQGYNHTWLLGHTANTKMRINFTDSTYSLISEMRKMTFRDTQGNISDGNGNFLMSSNGIWIANANGDTMQNGSGLNPGAFVNDWPLGLPIPNANLILPLPGDSTRYTLIHHPATNNIISYPVYELLTSTIDMILDNGLGGVVVKNDTILQDTLGWGLGACKHGNGRDWWIVALKDSSDIIFKFLLTPSGVTLFNFQHLGLQPFPWGNVTQPIFSPNGEKFAFSYAYYPSNHWKHDVRVFDFDRCTGNLTNGQLINVTDSMSGVGISFSANSQFLYSTSILNIYQINTDTTDLQSSLQLVAQNDTFYSPFPPFLADFDLMYLAANGKIYITSGNSVQHIHFINYPDSSGITCDVQQHAINLNGVWNFRTVPNHPNYYLGVLTGSPCDTLTSNIELAEHDFRFSVSPNPNNGQFKIMYMLPQNQKGKLEIFDINGRRIYEMNLPPWSTMQVVSLPNVANGVYHAVISSGSGRVNKKLVVFHQ